MTMATTTATTMPIRTKQTKTTTEYSSCPSYRGGHLPHIEDVQRLQRLTDPHVESFDYFLDHGLSAGVQAIEKFELSLVDPEKLRTDPQSIDYGESPSLQFWLENPRIRPPVRPPKSGEDPQNPSLLPRECRERGLMYAGPLQATFCYRVIQRRNGFEIPDPTVRLEKDFGNMPIMVRSRYCHLRGMTPAQLVLHREEQNEMGGYFIVSGIERCVRLLQIPRRNHPTAIQRSSYQNRGSTYTDLGVSIRCSRHNGDQSSITNTLHYLSTGGATLKFTARKQEFLIPVILILRALSGAEDSSNYHMDAADAAAGSSRGMGITDEELYRCIVQGDEKNTFLVARAGLLLQEARAKYGDLNTPEECLAFLGSRFRRLTQQAETKKDVEVGHYVIRQYILIHVASYKEKLDCLLLMIRKLYSFAAGDSCADNADSLQNQEILLPGHLMSTFVKEKFIEFLESFRNGLVNEMRKDFDKTYGSLSSSKSVGKLVDRYSGVSSGGIGKKVQHFLSTGNIISTTGLDLMQVSGYTIVAEKLNFLRYCAHFRSVHRGQFFMEMKTTAVRKLLPDQWGFLCPVHTPDGGPCGLLSHLSLESKVMAFPSLVEGHMTELNRLLISFGVTPSGITNGGWSSTYKYLPVVIDGKVIGSAPPGVCKTIASHLRSLKVASPPQVPTTLEIAYIPPGTVGTPFPGLFLFLASARLVRPVLNRASGKKEFIGPLEQAFMDIACLDEDIREGITTHQELDPTNMLSLIANLTPFSDQNQSPRNMYQCQMGKQTMGTPCHSLPYRPDNKLYKLETPQAPLVQTKVHGMYKMDEYPNGTNAVVAVLSYTGFDMEDAMILSKGSFERGMANASVFKTIQIDLKDEAKMVGATPGSDVRLRFSNKIDGNTLVYDNLDADGLPKVGSVVQADDPLYCVVDSITGSDKAGKQKDKEIAYVDSVRLLGDDSNSPNDNKVSITLRYPRRPVIGDKFSSRHGQKGVLSILWPHEDMPFSESGISPDIIINPHAFPSRMTIGMLVESMAGKSGALHGHFQDATPFTFHESGEKVSIDYFGEQLQAAGYNYYGSEPLYSGVSGCLLQADLYIGVVYYQRLRHMVSDKYQCRASGPTNELTRQPIKGRKKGGGIRLGEMERDSLLSHGAAFLLHDRLLNCSDKHVAYVCSRCGDMLTPITERSRVHTAGQSNQEIINKPKLRLFCRNPSCVEVNQSDESNDEAIEPLVMPYVYRYLINELAAMNIKIRLELD